MIFDVYNNHPVIASINADGRFKVALCRCGQKARCVAAMPVAETMPELVKDFLGYQKQGRTIKIINTVIDVCYDESQCNHNPTAAKPPKQTKPTQPTLFD